MKIEIRIEGASSAAWLKNALEGYIAAQEADRAEADKRWEEQVSRVAPPAGEPPAEAPVEAEKPKATRSSKKIKVEEPAPEQAQITTSPEDRKPADSTPVEDIEEAEVVTETAPEVDVFEDVPAPKVYTRDDVKAAMQAYVTFHGGPEKGMVKLGENAATLLGAPKLSAIPDDPAAFEAAVKRLEAASA